MDGLKPEQNQKKHTEVANTVLEHISSLVLMQQNFKVPTQEHHGGMDSVCTFNRRCQLGSTATSETFSSPLVTV